MIKLKTFFNHKGLLFDSEAVLSLSPEQETKMVEAGSAEYFTINETPDSLKPPAESIETPAEQKPVKKDGKQ